MVSRIMVKRLIAIRPDGFTKPEISGVGRPMTSISVASQPGELRNWDWAEAASASRTKMVTWKPWDPAKRFPSSITGMTWPIPGLANMTACGLVICIASVDKRWLLFCLFAVTLES